MPSDGTPYALFAFSALLPWTFFNTAVTTGTNSLVTHTQLITKVYFPREILPLTYLVAALFDFAIGFVVLAGLMAWYHVPFTSPRELVPSARAAGRVGPDRIARALGIQVRFRDIGVALPVLLQLLMFASPIIYPLSVVPPAWRDWYLLNPWPALFRRSATSSCVTPRPTRIR